MLVDIQFNHRTDSRTGKTSSCYVVKIRNRASVGSASEGRCHPKGTGAGATKRLNLRLSFKPQYFTGQSSAITCQSSTWRLFVANIVHQFPPPERFSRNINLHPPQSAMNPISNYRRSPVRVPRHLPLIGDLSFLGSRGVFALCQKH